MSNETQKAKQKPIAYHIFLEGAEGNRYAGVAYRHKKGSGLGFVIGGMRYVAFAPKQPEEAVKE